MIRDNPKRVGTSRHGAPPELAARLETGKDLFRGSRVRRARIDLLRRVHLRRSEARRPIVARAEQRLRIKMTAQGIFDETVLDAVVRVAGVDRRFVNHRVLLAGDVARRIFECGLPDPQSAHHQMGPEIGGCARHDAVVIGGETLCFFESLLAT